MAVVTANTTIEHNGIRIRPAVSADSMAIQALIATIFADYGYIFDPIGEEPQLRDPAAYFARNGGAFWVAEDGRGIAGVVGAYLHADFGSDASPSDGASGRLGELKSLYVRRDARRTGLGSRLTQLCIDFLRDAGRTHVFLWSDTQFADAHRLYERMGFQRTDIRHLRETNTYSEYRFDRT